MTLRSQDHLQLEGRLLSKRQRGYYATDAHLTYLYPEVPFLMR